MSQAVKPDVTPPPAPAHPDIGGWWQRLQHGLRRWYARADWSDYLGADWPDHIMDAEVTDDFNAKQGRSTGRVVLKANGKQLAVYLKRHFELPRWDGILAALWPSGNWSPAMQERENLKWARAQHLPVPKVVAAGEFLGPWGKLQSFLAIEELTNMLPLHQAIPLASRQLAPAAFRTWKAGLTREVARLARFLHDHARYHKDLYLCHFFIARADISSVPTWTDRVFMIDFHRLAHHPLTRPFWATKDLGQLLYSSEVEGVDARDRLRFWHAYLGSDRNGILGRWLRRIALMRGRRYRDHNAKWAKNVDDQPSGANQALETPTLDPVSEARREKSAARMAGMNIAFCYESVLPSRGGCETYIADLARRLLADHHEVHIYASRWDAQALPKGIQFHAIAGTRAPRFLKPWIFGRRCLDAMSATRHDVTMGFDKTWGLDVLYPQGGLHAACAVHNLRKHANPMVRHFARFVKWFDVANWSYSLLERRQYLGNQPSSIVVNSHMVRDHFMRHYHIPPGQLHVVRSAIDLQRFPEQDRLKCRLECREQYGILPHEVVGLFAAMNYHLKGLEPLLYAVQRLFARPEFVGHAPPFRLMVVGHPKARAYVNLAKKLGVDGIVRFVGYCPEMRNAYFAADFLVHPTFYDPCSLVVLEALACGLPIITTRYNGASELMHPSAPHQEGYVLSDPHDHQELAWCMAQMLDTGRRHAFAQAARRTATQWTFEQHYRQLMTVLEEAAQRKQAA